MPEFCLETPCIQCDYGVVRNGKLMCNYGNRLGISKELNSYEVPQPSKETVEKRRAETKKAVTKEEAEGQLQSLEKVMEKVKEHEEKKDEQ